MAATRQIVERWPQIKVIGLTMHADDVSLDAMREAGAFDCLSKSGPTETLVSAICAATGTTTPWPRHRHCRFRLISFGSFMFATISGGRCSVTAKIVRR